MWRVGSVTLASFILCQEALGGSNDITPKDLKDLNCMISVVRAAPHTSDVKSDRVRLNGTMQLVVKWHYDGPDGPIDLEFTSGARNFEDRTLTYSAVFANGVQPGSPPPGWTPPDWGANAIVDSWKKKCGIEAGIVSF